MSTSLEIRTEQERTLVATKAAYAEYERRRAGMSYAPDDIGTVRTLIERQQASALMPQHPKLSTIWDGELHIPFSSDPSIPYVVLMFVSSLDGKVSLTNPGDIGGGETDYWLYANGIRLGMDAVAGGKETVCGDPKITLSLYDADLVHARNTIGLPRHPLQVLISGSGDITPAAEYVFAVPEFRTVVLTSNEGAAKLQPRLSEIGDAKKEILVVGQEPRALNFYKALQVLKSRYGVQRMLLVGGAAVATAFLEAGVVQELFLTQSPRLLGGNRNTFFGGTGFLPEEQYDAQLLTLKVGGPHESVLFSRWSIPLRIRT